MAKFKDESSKGSKKICNFETVWMELEEIILSEPS